MKMASNDQPPSIPHGSATLQTPANPLGPFHPFSRLPKNLRCRIWKMALPECNAYIVYFFGENDATYEFQDWQSPPVGLSVNQEARTQTLRWYKKIPLFSDEYDQESAHCEIYVDDASDNDNEKNIRGKKRRRLDKMPAFQGKYLGCDVPEWQCFVYINFETDWIYLKKKTKHYLSERPFATWDWSGGVENLGMKWQVWRDSEKPLQCIVNSFPSIQKVYISGEDVAKPFPLRVQVMVCEACHRRRGVLLEKEFIEDKTEMTATYRVVHRWRKLFVTVVGFMSVVNNVMTIRTLEIELK